MPIIIDNLRPKDEHSFINYDELEQKYDIHKYYPKFLHNEDIETPEIKDMIYDKPIYSKANEHIKDWKNPGVKEIYETELNLDSGKLKINKQYLDKSDHNGKQDKSNNKNDRKVQRQEHKAERKDARLAKKEDKLSRKEDKIARKQEKIRNKRQLERRKFLIDSKEKPKIEFTNPFDGSMKINDLVSMETTSSESRKNSITNRLFSLMSHNSDELELTKTSTFDQTKSDLTNKRKSRSFFKKRLSEQIGTYTNKIQGK